MPITITALQDTFLKKSTSPSGTLPENEKVSVNKGKTYQVIAYNPPADGHIFVTLGYHGGSWYCAEGHWSGFPSTTVAPPPPSGTMGPIKTPQDYGFKEGDTHLIIDDVREKIRAVDFKGNLLWERPALARGQYGDYTFSIPSSDTPPGIYKIGTIYNDYAVYGAYPPYNSTLASYGWVSFDLISLDGLEEDLGRAGIMIHGGGSGLGWPGAWAPKQPLLPTLGCIRLHNEDCLTLVLPLCAKGQVFVSVYQEAGSR